MKNKWICLMLSLLLLTSTALAEPSAKDSHLLWDIPFGITATQLSEHLDQLGLFHYSWLQAETGEGVRIVTDSGSEFSYFDIPVSGILFDFNKQGEEYAFEQALLLFDIDFADGIAQYVDAFLLLTQNASQALDADEIHHPFVMESAADTTTEIARKSESLLQSELDRETLMNTIEQGYVNHCSMTIGNMECWLEYSMNVGRLMLIIRNDASEKPAAKEPTAKESTPFVLDNGLALGMNKIDVINRLGGQPSETSSNERDIFTYVDKALYGFDMTLYCYFGDDNTLIFTVALLSQDYKNSNQYFEDFALIETALISAYGTPDIDQKYTWTGTVSENLGYALALGNVNVFSHWLGSDGMVAHSLQNDDGKVHHMVTLCYEQE